MLNRLRQWFTPKQKRIAHEKRRLEAVLAEAGLSHSQRKKIVSAFFNCLSGKSDQQ